MDSQTDNEIMLQVKKGDLDQMSLLFRRHHTALFGFAFSMTGNRQVSEDVVQNVFYRMLKYRHTFTGTGAFKVWMFHLCRNLLNDHFKKNNQTIGHQDIETLEEKIADDAKPDEKLEIKQMQLQLNAVFNKLSKEDKEILALSKFQGLRYNEIAKLLNISEGAVKVRVHRAFNELKNVYLKNNLL